MNFYPAIPLNTSSQTNTKCMLMTRQSRLKNLFITTEDLSRTQDDVFCRQITSFVRLQH